MSEGQDRSIDAPAEETRSAADNRVLDPPLTAGERWELIKFKIMEDMNGRLWTVFTRTITVLGLFIALVTALGYFGIPYYVRSIFNETLELEKKSFDKLHNDITTKQQHLYFDEKIFVALLDRYLRDEQTMRSVISQAVVDIDQSETLSSTDMLEFKKTLVNGIQKMATNEMMVDEFKKLHRELLQKNATTKVLTLNGVREAFLIYPHIWALDRTLRGSVARIAVKDSTDEEAKSIIDKEYDTNFYQIYRKQFDLFETDTFMYAGQTWGTLQPSTASLFPSLDPYWRDFSVWREKRQTSP